MSGAAGETGLEDRQQGLEVGLLKSVLTFPRYLKRMMMGVLDILLCAISAYLAFLLRLGDLPDLFGPALAVAVLAILVVPPVFWLLGLYRAIFRYVDARTVANLVRATLLAGVPSFVLFSLLGVNGVPRTVGVIQPLLLLMLVICARVAARMLLIAHDDGFGSRHRPRAMIYGAGSAGRQVQSVLSHSRDLRVEGFFDDDRGLQGHTLNGLPICNPRDLGEEVAKRGIEYIILALPSASRQRRNEIIRSIQGVPVHVQTVPGFADIVAGRVPLEDVRELGIDDLLGRGEVSPDEKLIGTSIAGRIVLVTGAGGSIGSELCRQIALLRPHTLLLLELNEFALYSIEQELRKLFKRGSGPKLVPLLGSVQDAGCIEHVLASWHPDTIYHAAAYKHVPLVEHNPVEGIRNNAFGTLTLARAAIAADVANFVLISTDKAVRPTNVMGASKRLAEQVLQALSVGQSKTCFAIVRFGNVLGSSGSVVPLFREQIRDGGPVTVTHPEVTRYFMTISEAAQLVIQAGAMAEGGEVFVLDMGEPVRIYDLARRMIELTGLTVRDDDRPDGDIAIEIIGMRPGEKLYEELLIGRNPAQTPHPLIMKASETFLPWQRLSLQLQTLEEALDSQDFEQVRRSLIELVPEYFPDSNVASPFPASAPAAPETGNSDPFLFSAAR